MHHALFLPKMYYMSAMAQNELQEGYLLHPVGSSSLSSLLLLTSSVAKIDWFVLVHGLEVETTTEGRVDKVDWSPEGLESGGLFTASPSCLLANSAAHLSLIACLWEGMGSAIFRGSTSLLDMVTICFGQGTDKAPLFPDIGAKLWMNSIGSQVGVTYQSELKGVSWGREATISG